MSNRQQTGWDRSVSPPAQPEKAKRTHLVLPTSNGARLSPRELEICRLVTRGLPNKTIAAVLDISHWTVATHLRRIFAKLNVSSRAALVARYYESRGMDLDEPQPRASTPHPAPDLS